MLIIKTTNVDASGNERAKGKRLETTGRDRREIFIYMSPPLFNYVMGILLDLIKIALILVIALLAITIIFRLLPLLILVALVLLVIWFLFYRNHPR